MARIFSYDEIRSGRVPSIGDFAAAREVFEESATVAVERGEIATAMIFGSVALGAATSRSDFDCMIVPIDDSQENHAVASELHRAVDLATRGRVQVNPILHNRARLASGMHEIDRFFGSHLVSPDNIVVGENPESYITYADDSPYQIFTSYIRQKKRRILYTGDPRESKALVTAERLLELPSAIARKALRAIDEIEGSEFTPPNTAHKSEMTRASMAFYSQLDLQAVPARLRQLNRRYGDALDDAVRGDMSRQQYDDLLFGETGSVASETAAVGRWLDAVDCAVSRRLALD